ncbi:MAG: methyltransferase domain-containing protein [Acidimicrobiales bacterium]
MSNTERYPTDPDHTPSDPTDPNGTGRDGTDRYVGFPEGFFGRIDEGNDASFYVQPRLLTHIDEGAIAAVSALYGELGVNGRVLDVCSSWISHLPTRPATLTVLGMNAAELAANELAHEAVVHDLNEDPRLPFASASFDAALCTVSVDYLTRPIQVFDEVARVLVAGGYFACTFSNRCFPTKAIRGWLASDDSFHLQLVAEYFRRSVGWDPPQLAHRNPGANGDPLYAVWARRSGSVTAPPE